MYTERQDTAMLGDSERQSTSGLCKDKNQVCTLEQIQSVIASALSAHTKAIEELAERSRTESQARKKDNEELAERIRTEIQATIKTNNEELAERSRTEIRASTKAREELAEIFKTEIQKAVDKVTEQSHRDIGQLWEEKKGEISSVRDEPCEEMNAKAEITKQEIEIPKQDVSRDNQEVQARFIHTDLVNENKFVEVERQGTNLKEQVAAIAKGKAVQPQDSIVPDAMQIQPMQSGSEVVSEPGASIATCMNESVENEWARRMYENVYLSTTVNLPMPNSKCQGLSELALPKFSRRDQSAVLFLEELDDNLNLKSINENVKLAFESKSLTEEFAKSWFRATKDHFNSYEEFRIKNLGQFWSDELQSQIREQNDQPREIKGPPWQAISYWAPVEREMCSI